MPLVSISSLIEALSSSKDAKRPHHTNTFQKCYALSLSFELFSFGLEYIATSRAINTAR